MEAISSLDKVREGDLYALLALCTKEELDPLVQVILSKVSNGFDVNDEYKRHQPDHTKYAKLIGDEIRLFGGHTLMNISRGGDGPPYDEVVADVCWKLDLPFQKGRTIENEANLLNFYLEKRWRSLAPTERERVANIAREAALKSSLPATWYSKAASFSLVSAMSVAPVSGGIGTSMFDPSYQTTIPCVLHVAFLRRLLIDERRGDLAVDDRACVPADAVVDGVGTGTLELQDEAGDRFFSLGNIAEPQGRWHAVDGNDEGVSRLNAFVQAVPALGTAAEVAGATGTRYMEVVCKGDLVKAVNGGGYRGFSMGAEGVKEHANLFGVDKLAALANASAVMNIASVALAQKHLADISEKLTEIKKDVGQVAAFQKAERRAALTGSIAYFEQVAPALLEGEHEASVQGQIERHEADLIRVQHHLEADLQTAVEALESIRDGGWFTSSQFVQDVEKQQREINGLLRQLLYCLQTRALGWQLLCMFPGGEGGKRRRRDDIISSLGELTDCGERLSRVDSVLRGKLQAASSVWSSTSMNASKLDVLQASDDVLNALSIERDRISDSIAYVERTRTALERPFRMALRIEDGQVAGVQPLEPT